MEAHTDDLREEVEHSVPGTLGNTQEEYYHTESQGEQMTQNEFMTQNELTQLGDFDEENMSPPPTQSPINPRSLPWGRLIPCSRHWSTEDQDDGGGGRIDFFPRDPVQRKGNGGCSFLGLSGLEPSDTFNEYTLGRSPKCDIVAIKPPPPENESETEAALNEWAHGMISNRHCRIFCMLKTTAGGAQDLEVYVEDSSGNGTLVNSTTLLRRGEKRILHTGDEICLINQKLLRKRMRSTESQSEFLRHHSFIFVNVYQQQGRHSMGSLKQRLLPSPAVMPPPASAAKRRGLVDVRATNNHSIAEYRNAAAPSVLPNTTDTRQQQRNNRPRVSPRRQPPRRIEEHYDIRDLLGSGTCGEVRRAIHRRTGEERAVKIIATGKRSRSSLLLASSSAFEAEAAMLQELDHPYVVKLIDVFVNPGTAIYMVMELTHGGDLFDRIVKKGKYTEIESRRVMRRLLNAVHYLHEDRDIVHRDLKPENILCVNRDSDIDVKLTDFGLAKSVTEEGLKTFCGTPQYFAPEVLRRRHTVAGRGRYGKQADMWSLGVILYILLSGTPPFDLEQGIDIVAEAQIQFPQETFRGVSSEAKNLVKKLLRIDPNKRLSVKEACQHEWILTDDGDTHTHPLDDPATSSSRGEHENEDRSHDDDFGTSVAKEGPTILLDDPAATSLEEKHDEGNKENRSNGGDFGRVRTRVAEGNTHPLEVRTTTSPVLDHDTEIKKNGGDHCEKATSASEDAAGIVVHGVESTKTNGESSAGTTPTSRNTLSPRILNQHLENFRQELAKSGGAKEALLKNDRKQGTAGRSRVKPAPLNIVVAPNGRFAASHMRSDEMAGRDEPFLHTSEDHNGGKEDNDQDDTRPLELSEDEICSQFSDEEIETVSSFGTSSEQSCKKQVERIPSTSSSSLSEKDSPVAQKVKRSIASRAEESKRKSKKRRKSRDFASVFCSPSAAADEGNIWKHVSGDEQSEQPLKSLPTIKGSNKSRTVSKNARSKKSHKVVGTGSKHTQTTLASFFRKKRGS